MPVRSIVKEKPIASEHVPIGHDILSLISSAMYVEPLTIYRELVQNCADSVDDAVVAGILEPHEARVDLTVDALHRQIVVRDNGAGVGNADFIETMCAIGASPKRGSSARGFRGIGRLVGLGYAQELVFRSRSNARERVMEAVWDARLLKELLRSRHRAPLDEVVAEVVKVSERTAGPEEPERFFEVELRKVVRLSDDALLNAQAVERYLSQVAPVPFDPAFSHGEEISRELREHGPYQTIDVRVNAGECLTRPYRDELPISASKTAHIADFEVVTIPSYDGDQIAAMAWVARHEHLGAFPRRLGVRGLRARVGNLQIGDERVFAAAFPEERFADWTIGEVHVYDPRITPNGRRDDFEPSLHLSNLLAHLAAAGKDAARVARSSSAERRIERGFASVQAALKEYGRLLKLSPEAHILRDELMGDVRAELDRAQRRLVGSDHRRWERQISEIKKQIEKTEAMVLKAHGRATQREMGRVDVLRALRSQIPGGLQISTALLKVLAQG